MLVVTGYLIGPTDAVLPQIASRVVALPRLVQMYRVMAVAVIMNRTLVSHRPQAAYISNCIGHFVIWRDCTDHFIVQKLEPAAASRVCVKQCLLPDGRCARFGFKSQVL